MECKMQCRSCSQYNECNLSIKDLNHRDIRCLKCNRVKFPCLPGDDVYWIDEHCEGAPKIRREPAAVEAVCYYGKGDFRVVCHGDSTPEKIGTKFCYLTREDAERVLAAMQQNEE